MVANAQDFWSFENLYSPFMSFPLLHGEAKLTPIVVGLQKGYFGFTSPTGSSYGGDLYNYYQMNGSNLFLDVMVRFQLGRFSSRTYFERREFAGLRKIYSNGSQSVAGSALDYWGCREGGDIDIFLGNKSRVGFNFDYSLYGPTFTVFIPGDSPSNNSNVPANASPLPFKVMGPPHSGTIGAHAIYNPVWDIYGMGLVVEAWAHWPIFGTALTDYEISGGLKSPETVLGSFALTAGFRWTSISFALNATDYAGLGDVNLNATWDGVFGSLVYYYR